VPVKVEPMPANVTHLVAGLYHVMVSTGSGAVYAWGDDEDGQIGDGAPQRVQTIPTLVPLPNVALQISAGGFSSYALTPGGWVWYWGANLQSATRSQATPNPTPVIGLPSAAWIGAGDWTFFVSLRQ